MRGARALVGAARRLPCVPPHRLARRTGERPPDPLDGAEPKPVEPRDRQRHLDRSDGDDGPGGPGGKDGGTGGMV